MSLLEDIEKDYLEAYKAKSEQLVSTLRMLRSALKNKKIDLKRELEDKEVLQTIKTQAKQLKDALDSFVSGGRDDLVEKTKKELEILNKYLPEQMPESEARSIIEKVAEEIGVAGKADFGKLMGAVMKALADKADSGMVKQIVQEIIDKKSE